MHNIIRVAVVAFLTVATLYPFINNKPAPTFQMAELSLKSASESAPDFAAISDVKTKKKAFFDFMRSNVSLVNNHVEKQRASLLDIEKAFFDGQLSSKHISYAKKLGELYYEKLSGDTVTKAWLDNMLHKVNVLPEALVLTQAANETAWGTSRFAREANNYFGQWCYKKGCGLVPLERIEGAFHEVAKFSSALESVNAYFLNVNRNKAYKELREIRYQLAINNRSILDTDAATQLTNGLLRYSERGQEYVNDLQSMIRVNHPFLTVEES